MRKQFLTNTNNMTNKIERKKSKLRRPIFLIFLILAVLGITSWWYYYQWSLKTKEIPKKLEKKEIYTDFAYNKFNSKEEYRLLKELGICDTTRSENEFGACSPKYFRFFKLNRDKKLSDGFLLLINGIAFQDVDSKFPIRRLLVFEREGGKLVAVNKFKGNLIETREVPNSPYNDILIRFKLDQYNEKYHVLFTWKKNKYQLERCEELSYFDIETNRFVGGRVLKSKIDSVSREVEKILKQENLVF